MQGGYNFRDLGGFKTKEGKSVQWGKVFRSDDLSNMTDQDLEYLSNIPLLTVVDFRSEEEIDKAPDRLPSSLKNYYKFCINPGNLKKAVENLHNMTSDKIDDAMMELNCLLVSDKDSIQKYTQFFALLQSTNNIPLLFHCSAGKDRTGMAAALFLYALGVEEKEIWDDYLSSNVYLGDKYRKYVQKYPNLKSLFEVKASYLKAGIDKVKKDFGSVQNYLIQVLKVDVDKLKSLYLE